MARGTRVCTGRRFLAAVLSLARVFFGGEFMFHELVGHVSPEEHAGLLARLWPPPLGAVCPSLRALSRGPNFVENFGNFRQLCLNRRWSAMALPGYLGITEPVSHARNPACLWQFIFWAVNYLGVPAKLVFP